MESTFEPRVAPGYLVAEDTRLSVVIEGQWTNQRAGLECARSRRDVVGGIQHTAALLMSSPKRALIPTDVPTGIPLSAQRRT